MDALDLSSQDVPCSEHGPGMHGVHGVHLCQVVILTLAKPITDAHKAAKLCVGVWVVSV